MEDIRSLSHNQKINSIKNLEIYKEVTLVYLLAPHTSSLQTGTLQDVYHINRLKQARVMTSHGIVISIKGLTEAETIPL